MFAVIRTGGKQYRVTPSQILKVEKLEAEARAKAAEEAAKKAEQEKIAAEEAAAKAKAEAEAALALIGTPYFAYCVVSYSILVLLYQDTTHADVL